MNLFESKLVLRCSGVLLFLLLGSFAEAHGETAGPARVGTGTLLLEMANGYAAAASVSTDVEMDVSGLIARVAVRQTFENVGTEWAEGLYVFPLPERAAVDRLRLRIGERLIEGQIREREQARKEYEQARRAGQKASLVAQERPNIFTTAVANIAPGESVIVEIEYLETLEYVDGMFSLRFPLAMTPRYMPGSPLPIAQGDGWAPDTSEVPDASRISPPVVAANKVAKAAIRIRLDAGLPLDVIASRYHPVDVRERQGRYEITLRGERILMDRDFELTWRPVADAAPRALLFEESTADARHFLLMVMPPAIEAAHAEPAPREQVFIIDTSGSMHGTSLAQAKAALLRALARLRQGDRFNVIAFNSTPTALFPVPAAATARNLRFADGFIRALEASGGTEMRTALEIALDAPAQATHVRQLIFITDGAVGNEEALFSLIEKRLGTARLFTVGIGSAPNGWFMRKAAEAGRGSHTLVGSQHEIEEKMDRLFEKIERPQVTDIRLAWPGGIVVEPYPGVVPDLYAGEPVTVSARIEGPIATEHALILSGNTPGGAWRAELPLATGHASPGVAALWARGRIAALADEMRRSPDAAPLRNAIVETALEHNLVSRFTSLVAVDRTPARSTAEALRRAQVPATLPHGQDMNASFGFPNTGTDSLARMLAGLTLLSMAGLLTLAARCRAGKTHAACA